MNDDNDIDNNDIDNDEDDDDDEDDAYTQPCTQYENAESDVSTYILAFKHLFIWLIIMRL